MTFVRLCAGIAVPLLVVVLFSTPAGGLGLGTIGGVLPGAPIASAPPHSGSLLPAQSARTAPVPATLGPRPATGITVCPNPDPYGWGAVDSVVGISPNQGLQTPCPPVGQDEAHVTFSSNVAGSGEQWTLPVFLAPGGANSSPVDHFIQESVGMVVAGDPHSAWGQSYAEVVFVPNSSTTYVASLHILALEAQSASSAPNGLLFTWNDTVEEESDYANATEVNGFVVTAGDTVAVTFDGVKGGTSGLDVWVNDTTDTSVGASYVLNSTDLGGPYNFTPYYDAACTDTCVLQWSFEFGEGVGFSNCPINAIAANPCSSYNQGFWSSAPSPAFGHPEFWRNGGYNGDFYYFAAESASGICNQLAAPDTTTGCYNFDMYNGQGFYPYFTFNATGFDFGTNSSYTLENLGGYSFEYPVSGAASDRIPEFFYRNANTSLAGYIPSGSTLGVSADMLDLGSIGFVNLTYSLNSGPPTTLAMSPLNGTLSFGNWTATIPSGADGTINYTITATNDASAIVSTPTQRVVRGPLPVFQATLLTEDPACATIVVNGTSYANGSILSMTPGFYSLHAAGCYPWVFNGWRTVTGGTAALQSGSVYSTLELSASGTLEAQWIYVRPLDTVTVSITPVCGQVFLNGTPEGNGAVVQLLDEETYPIGHVGCANEAFRGWTFTGPFTVLGSNLSIAGNGTLVANYISASGASALIFETNPGTCGGVLFFGAGYVSNESVSVAPGTYPIAPDPCSHWGFYNFTFTGHGSVAANNSWITLTGGGTLTENNYVLTIVTFVISPPFCGPIIWDGVDYTNGGTLVVANDSTHSVYAAACPGHYLIALTGTGGVSVIGNIATVTGSGEVIASYGAGNATQFLGFLTDPSACGGIIEGGSEFTDSQYTYLAPGSIATVSAVPCAGYGFLNWITYGMVVVVGTTAYFNGSGALEAVFRPLTGILIFTSPTGCGSVMIGGADFTGNSTVSVTEGVQYAVTAVPCVGDAFVQWVNSSGAELSYGPYAATNSVSALAESILTAQFAPVRYTVLLTIDPPACGAIRVSNSEYINGSSLTVPVGVYPLGTVPCTGDHLVRWTTTGGVAVAGESLYVNGSGTLGAIYLPVPPTVVITVSNSSFAGESVVISATVAVPIPPFNYNYTWSFGDGTSSLTTPVNFTAHAFASAGRYNVSVIVMDPINRTANASAFILVVQGSPFSSPLLTPLSLAAIGLVVIVAILSLAVVLIGRRPSAGAEGGPEDTATPPAEGTEPVPASPETSSPTGEQWKP
jgi:hypothetical protein